jgi:ligand-binding sensor domain-containing protein
LCVYNPRTDLITPFQGNEFDITDEVYALCRDSLGDVWVLGSTSFYRISRDSTRNRCFNRKEYFSPTCVCVTRSGDLWMAAWDGGLHRYDAVRDTFDNYQVLTPDEQQELNYITTLVETPSGQLFIGTRTQGARLFSPLTAKVQRLFTTDTTGQPMYIHCALDDSHDNVWIGTEAGIYEWNGQQGLFAHERKDLVRPNALIDNAVHVLYEDHSGGIWVGTYFGGICYKSGDEAPFSERLVTDDHGMPVGNVVREIAADDHGRLWVTTEDCGLCMMEQPDAPLRQLLLTWKGRRISNNVQTVAIVGQTAWIGTFDEGIYLIDVNTRNITAHFTTNDGSGLPDIAVVHIIQTRKGQVLVGTMNGLSCYDGHGHFIPIEALNGAFVHDIMEAQDGSLWVASLNRGLFRISGEGTRLIAQSEPVPMKDLATVAEDADHRIVIGTHSDGFHFYDPLTHELSEAMLPDCGISRILRDALGNLWLTTTKGLFCYAPADSSITAYGISEGLTLDHFSRNSGFQDNQGIIYAGTMAGLVSFNPRHLRASAPSPAVFFVRQLPDGKPLLFTDHIVLPHDATFSLNTPPMPQRPHERSGTATGWKAPRPGGQSPRAHSPSVSTTCLRATMRFIFRLPRKTDTGPTKKACCTCASANLGGGRGRRALPGCCCWHWLPSSSIRPTSVACGSDAASPPNRPTPAVTARCCRASSTSSPPSPTRSARHSHSSRAPWNA